MSHFKSSECTFGSAECTKERNLERHDYFQPASFSFPQNSDHTKNGMVQAMSDMQPPEGGTVLCTSLPCIKERLQLWATLSYPTEGNDGSLWMLVGILSDHIIRSNETSSEESLNTRIKDNSSNTH